MVKNSLRVCMILGLLTLAGQSAHARAEYVSPLNQALVTTGLSCNACHNSSGTTAGTATLPLIAAWNNRNSIAMVTVDSDGDANGNSNGIEVRMGTDLNDSNLFTAGAAANAVFVSTANSVVTATATDLAVETNSTFALASGDSILSGKSITPTLPTAGSVSLAFEDANILTAKVYQVVGTTATELTPVTVNSTGSITFTTTDATPKLLIVGTSASASTAGLTHGEASVVGCISGDAGPLSLLMFLSLLFLLRRTR